LGASDMNKTRTQVEAEVKDFWVSEAAWRACGDGPRWAHS